jgi:DNA polymerase bacteriophage-type
MTKHVLYRDYETRSECNLKKCGAYMYARHPRTEVLCVGYAIDRDPVKLLVLDRDGIKPPPEFVRAAKEPDWIVVAHNDTFERQIENEILHRRHGWPLFELKKHRCTMATALALALPASLERAAEEMRTITEKDKEGARIMKRLSKPRRPLKDEDPEEVHYDEDEVKHDILGEYCMDDVEVTRELFEMLPPLTNDEQKLWELDARINDRGLRVDWQLIQKARQIAATANPALNEELEQLTNGAVSSFNKVSVLKDWIEDQGIPLNNLNKDNIEMALMEKLPSNVRRALEIRLLGAQAAVKKLDAIVDRRELDDRVRGSFRYHSAGTGRWSSTGIQVHNLKRISMEPDELTEAIKTIGSGNYAVMSKKYPNPLATIGSCIRAVIHSADDKVLIGADFSGIEARVTAWIAGEESKLKVFRDFDAGKGEDPYKIAASKIFGVPAKQITDQQRQVGKAAELAFGYQGGLKAYKKFAPKNTSSSAGGPHYDHGSATPEITEMLGAFSDAEIEKVKMKWRAAHPNIERFWHAINRAFMHVGKNPDEKVRCGRISLQMEDVFMRLTLPSGRSISYPYARISRTIKTQSGHLLIDQPRGYPSVIFKDNSAGQWRDVQVYGGLITENVVQGVARDVLAEAMVRIEAAGLPVVLHVHDEVVIEVPKRDAGKIEKQFSKLMMASPKWAEGLPLIAKTWMSDRYIK